MSGSRSVTRGNLLARRAELFLTTRPLIPVPTTPPFRKAGIHRSSELRPQRNPMSSFSCIQINHQCRPTGHGTSIRKKRSSLQIVSAYCHFRNCRPPSQGSRSHSPESLHSVIYGEPINNLDCLYLFGLLTASVQSFTYFELLYTNQHFSI